MSPHIFAVLYVVLMTVRAEDPPSDEDDPFLSKNPYRKRVSAHCLPRKDFIKKYDLQTYVKITDDQTNEYMIRRETSGLFRLSWITKFHDEASLVKVAEQRNAEDLEPIETEINFLIELNNMKATPNYYDCVYQYRKEKQDKFFRYFIILEKVYRNMYVVRILNTFETFSPSKQIVKFLQMAIAIQTIHSKGITHQNIRPENFVAMDAEINDIRLIDLSYAVRNGKRIIGGTEYFCSPDKLQKGALANYNQDAFAFALTMIGLLDRQRLYEKIVEDSCPDGVRRYTQECKNGYLDKSYPFTTDTHMRKLLAYIQDHYFNEKEPLNIGDIIVTLGSLYKEIITQDPSKDEGLTPQVEEILNRSKINIEKIKDLDAWAAKATHNII